MEWKHAGLSDWGWALEKGRDWCWGTAKSPGTEAAHRTFGQAGVKGHRNAEGTSTKQAHRDTKSKQKDEEQSGADQTTTWRKVEDSQTTQRQVRRAQAAWHKTKRQTRKTQLEHSVTHGKKKTTENDKEQQQTPGSACKYEKRSNDKHADRCETPKSSCEDNLASLKNRRCWVRASSL